MHNTNRRRGIAGLPLVVLAGLSLALMVGTSSAQGEGGLTTSFSAPVRGDFALAGNTNMVCPAVGDEYYDAACHVAGASTAQLATTNDEFYMRYANPSGDVTNASTAQLDIPAEASIVFARLYWSGNTADAELEGLPFTACNATQVNDGEPEAALAAGLTREHVRVDVDGAGYTNVVGTVDGQTQPGPGGAVYAASADVTSLLAGSSGSISITVADIATPEGNNCHGGWALIAVHDAADPSVPLRHVHVFEGFVSQSATSATTIMTAEGFVVGTTPAPRAGVVAYEGDRGISGDRFFVNGVAIGEPEISPALTSNNFFASSVDGATHPADSNSWGVDAKSVEVNPELVQAGQSAAALGFDTTGDSFYGHAVAFSVATNDVGDLGTSTSEPPADEPIDSPPVDTTVPLAPSTTADEPAEQEAPPTTTVPTTTTAPPSVAPEPTTTEPAPTTTAPVPAEPEPEQNRPTPTRPPRHSTSPQSAPTSVPTEVLSEVLTNERGADVATGDELAFTGRTSMSLVLLALTFLSSGAAVLVGGGMVRRRSWS